MHSQTYIPTQLSLQVNRTQEYWQAVNESLLTRLSAVASDAITRLRTSRSEGLIELSLQSNRTQQSLQAMNQSMHIEIKDLAQRTVQHLQEVNSTASGQLQTFADYWPQLHGTLQGDISGLKQRMSYSEQNITLVSSAAEERTSSFSSLVYRDTFAVSSNTNLIGQAGWTRNTGATSCSIPLAASCASTFGIAGSCVDGTLASEDGQCTAQREFRFPYVLASTAHRFIVTKAHMWSDPTASGTGNSAVLFSMGNSSTGVQQVHSMWNRGSGVTGDWNAHMFTASGEVDNIITSGFAPLNTNNRYITVTFIVDAVYRRASLAWDLGSGDSGTAYTERLGWYSLTEAQVTAMTTGTAYVLVSMDYRTANSQALRVANMCVVSSPSLDYFDCPTLTM